MAGQIAAGVAAGWFDAADAQTLTSAAALLWQVQAAGRLLTGGVLDPDAIGEGGRRMVLEQTGFQKMDDLRTELEAQTAAAAAVIDAKLAVSA